MTDPKEKGKPEVKTREPKKKLSSGIFDNLRKLPEPHPVEEILGLAPANKEVSEQRTPPTPATAPAPRTLPTPRTTRTSPIAPERDYTKVANSIMREAVAGGYFTGKSKQLYDFFYSKTRGAVVPARSIRITKPRLMQGAHIGSERTLLKNIAHLKSIGLIEVRVTDGEHGGNEYTVFLPEEVNLLREATPRTPPTPPTPIKAQQGHHAPTEVGGVPSVESAVGDVGFMSAESTTSGEAKTFSKDLGTIDDDDAALAGLNAALKRAAKEITGKEPSASESERWKELAELLVTEAKIAAARTTISSLPAFLTEHLRRRLWKKDKGQMEREGSAESPLSTTSSLTEEQIKACPDCGGATWFYPEGPEKGIKRCRHEKLTSQHSNEG